MRLRAAIQTTITVALLCSVAQGSLAQDTEAFIGNWSGTLHAGQQGVGFVFHITPNEEGALSASMDVPAQGGFGIQIEDIETEDTSITLKLPLPGGASYTGVLNQQKDVISGTFSQGNMSLPLDLARDDAAVSPQRPQEPTPPFPYLSENITFENSDAGITLAGTMTIPTGPGPYPGVVLISGSGPHDRDSSMMGHKPFLVLADSLTRQGIAVLRYDDRGTSESGGDHASATPEDFASDALAAVAFLSGHAGVDTDRVGLLGHSEGALAAIIATDRSDDVAFLISLVGSALPGSDALQASAAAMARANGASKAAVDMNVRILSALIRALEDTEAGESAVPQMRKSALGLIDSVDPATLASAGISKAVISQMIQQFDLPNSRFVMRYDPRPALRRSTTPTLAVLGGRDPVMPADDHAPSFTAAFADSPGDDHTVTVLPGLNHLLQNAESGAPAEFGRITETMSPDAMRLVSEWILARFGGK